jgi:hypothetical protein
MHDEFTFFRPDGQGGDDSAETALESATLRAMDRIYLLLPQLGVGTRVF